MADVSIQELQDRFLKNGGIAPLLEAAAIVANAVHAGAGALIAGSLMEADLRKALNLKKGELVNFAKHSSAPGEPRG